MSVAAAAAPAKIARAQPKNGSFVLLMGVENVLRVEIKSMRCFFLWRRDGGGGFERSNYRIIKFRHSDQRGQATH